MNFSPVDFLLFLGLVDSAGGAACIPNLLLISFELGGYQQPSGLIRGNESAANCTCFIMIGRNSTFGHLLLQLLLVLATSMVLQAAGGQAEPVNPCNPQPQSDDYILPLPQGQQIVFRRVYLRKKTDPEAHSSSRRRVGPQFDFTVTGSFEDADHRWYYLVGKYEVSERQWASIESEENSTVVLAANLDLPKRNVTKAKAQSFLDDLDIWLKENDSDYAHTYQFGTMRFPSESEWQFAARGGTEVSPEVFEQPYPYSDAELGEHEWFFGPDSADGNARAIGTKLPNPLGLHDMIGNVREWLLDYYVREDGRIGGLAVIGGSFETDRRIIGVKKLEVKGGAQTRDIGFRVVLGSLDYTEVKLGSSPKPEPVNHVPSPTPTRPAPSLSPEAPAVEHNSPPPGPVNPPPTLAQTKPTPSVTPQSPPARYPNPSPEPGNSMTARIPVTPAPSLTPSPASEYINSLGMQFLPVPGLNVRVSVLRTRRQDFQAFVDALRNDERLQRELQISVPTAWEKPMINGKLIEVTPDYPVVKVSWKEANAFCRWLSRTGNGRYRLPTAEEWWRARGGALYPWGNDKTAPPHALEEKLLPVRIWKNQVTGLYDLGTNVQEWSGSVLTTFADEEESKAIVLGHGWRTHFDDERAFFHSFLLPPKPTDAESIDSIRQPDIGFRCVMEP
jgi:formylglycine-generating enzyme required for sulfatase activity